MYRKKVATFSVAVTLVFTSCAGTGSGQGGNAGQGTEVVSTILGGLLGASAVKIRGLLTGKKVTNKDLWKGAGVGAVAGYIVGMQLSKMQNKYANKEKILISQILEIDKESKILADKNTRLTSELNGIKNEISSLAQSRVLGEKDKARQKVKLRAKLKVNKANLKALISKNRQISRTLSNSKSKAEGYTYDTTDRNQIMSDIGKLDRHSKKYERTLNARIASIDTMLGYLA